MMPGVILVPFPYCYQCPFKQNYPECGIYCIDYIEKTIFTFQVSPKEVAGILLEPLLGAGGYVAPPDEYWPEIRRICDEHNILFMADEVQTGFGRTGKMWASEHWGIEPDIMCMSKAAAAGLPFGICAAKTDVMDWGEGAHENTLGGNPIVMSAALAVLQVLTRDKLWKNAEIVGNHIKRRLSEIQEKIPIIGDVRGKGLMIGFELVKDIKTREPATEERNKLVKEAFRKGVLLLGSGPSSIRLAPPLIITQEQADTGLEIIEGCLKNLV
jgi:4-aminobutyrate aminotransferase